MTSPASPCESDVSFHKAELRRIGTNHICGLPKRDHIVVHYIRDGYFVSLRRKFRRILMVSESNPLCKVYLRSSAAIRMEQTKHLHYHYYVIHPFSQYQRYYEIFRLAILSMLLIVIPVDICSHNVRLTFFKLALDICTIFGMFSIFCTGFLRSTTHKIILNRRAITRRYLSRYFIIDCLTSSTIFLVLLQMCFPKHIPTDKVVYIKMVNYLKLFRLATWMTYWECFRQWRKLNIYVFKVMKLFLYYIFTIWWCACILYVIELFPKPDASMFDNTTNLNVDVLISCIYHVVYMIFQIGSGEQPTDRLVIILAQIVILLVGYYMYIYTVSQVMIIIRKCNSSKTKYLQIQQQLEDYLRQKEVPEYTRRRVMLYFDFRYQRHYYKENDVLGTMSKNLRQEIFLHRCMKLIAHAKMFKVIPPNLVNRFVMFLRPRMYLCNDLIVQAGTNGSTMYFVYSGTVAVYTPHGREVCHLTEGANFGEVSLIFENQTRAATVIAIDTIEMYTLSREDFLRAIEPFPDVYRSIRAAAEEQVNQALFTESDDSEDSHSSTDGSSTKGDSPEDAGSANTNKTGSGGSGGTEKSTAMSMVKVKSRLHYNV